MLAGQTRIFSGDAVFTFDDGLRILSWNAAAESLTGVTSAEAVGRHCWEVLDGRDRGGNLICHRGCSNARLVREGWPVRCHELVIGTPGGKRLLSLSTLRLEEPEGRRFVHVLAAPEPEARRPSAPRVTARQQEVLELLADGVLAKDIASRLGVREATVRNHIRALLTQLGAHSQLEAVATARRAGLLP